MNDRLDSVVKNFNRWEFRSVRYVWILFTLISLIFSLTADVEWDLGPFQVRINAFHPQYFWTSFFSYSLINSVNTIPFVFLSPITASSSEFSLIAAMIKYHFESGPSYAAYPDFFFLLRSWPEKVTLLLRLRTHQFENLWNLTFLHFLQNQWSSVLE